MSNWILEYILQILPIPLGLLIMLLIKNLRLHGEKIKIVSNAEHTIRHLGPFHIEHNISADGDFTRTAYNLLIQNGVWIDPSSIKEIRKAAFEKLGLIEEHELNNLGLYLKQKTPDRLLVYSANPKNVLRYLLHFGRNSGILLSYFTSHRLEIVVRE